MAKPRSPEGPTSTPDPQGTPPNRYPDADYSYTVELVASINRELGKLTEAVESLKEQSREQAKELRQVSKDVHAAKAIAYALLPLGGVLGFILKVFLDYVTRSTAK